MLTINALWLTLKKTPAWVWIALVLLAGGWYYGHTRYSAGQADTQATWDEAVARGQAEVDRLKAEAGKVTAVVETKYVDRVKVIHEKGATIVKQIPVYLPADAADLPAGFRVLHDAAARNEPLPNALSLADVAAVPLEDATRTVAENYEQCHVAYARVEAWQQWAREQCALTEGCTWN